MAEDYTKNIEDAKKSLAEARDILVNSYLGRLREVYAGGTEVIKNSIVGELELLVGEAESSFSIQKKYTFDSAIAESLRIKAGYKTQRELASHLNISNAHISNYESGKKIRKKHPHPNIRKYLIWLKEQGYNPFDL